MKRMLSVLLLVAVPVLTSGCSFWAVRGPSSTRDRDCTESVAAPVVDGVLAATALAGGVAGASTSSCSNCFADLSSATRGAGAVLIGLGVLEAAAATYGGIKVAACREVKARLEIPASQLRPAPALTPGKI